jgi:hypothetical protein
VRHSTPAYVPVNAHYVNPPGRRRAWPVVLTGALFVVAAALLVGFTIFMLAASAFSETPEGTPASWVTPTTYGPPPTTGATR